MGVQSTSAGVVKKKRNEEEKSTLASGGGEGGKLGDGVSGKESEVEKENVEIKKKNEKKKTIQEL